MRIYARVDMRAYRTAEWKLVRDFLNPERDELYHLATDPAEARNRIRDTSDPAVPVALAQLDAKNRTEMRRIGAPLAAAPRP